MLKKQLCDFSNQILFHSCDRVPHVSVGEDEDVEDVEDDAEDADNHRQVQVDSVVEILLLPGYQMLSNYRMLLNYQISSDYQMFFHYQTIIARYKWTV